MTFKFVFIIDEASYSLAIDKIALLHTAPHILDPISCDYRIMLLLLEAYRPNWADWAAAAC